jgi:hypothetical protein
VAEYELALALLAQRDRAGYETHILRAAALDPDYLDVRARIRPLFLGQVPDKFPVPDGTSPQFPWIKRWKSIRRRILGRLTA